MSRHQRRHDHEGSVSNASSVNGEEVEELQHGQLNFNEAAVQQQTPEEHQRPDHVLIAGQQTQVTDHVLGNDFQLNWPDSENLLQTILSAELENWPASEYLAPELPTSENHQYGEEAESPWVQSTTHQGNSHGGNDAVSNLSRLITSVVWS